MEVREATGYDIAKLLLLNAPKNFLQELELSNDNIEEHAEYFDECKSGIFGAKGYYCANEMLVLALYYSGKRYSGRRQTESAEILASIYIAPYILRLIIDLSEIEEFQKTENLLNYMHKQRLSIQNKKAVEVRHKKPGGSRDLKEQIRAIWASGKYSSRDICAEEEYAGLGYKSFKTARKALEGTAEPTRDS